MKKLINKLNYKIISSFAALSVIANNVFADVVSDVGTGGDIAGSILGTGVMNIIKDITGTLQWLIPTIGVGIILWNIIKIITGDEHENARYKKNIVNVLILIVIGLIAVTIVNLVAKYFGK